MLKKAIQFIKYNNAFSIGFALIFLSFGGALAAGPEGRQAVADAVYSEKETVRSIDNSYIINVDLNSYASRAQITAVTEDENYYYVDYKLFTIDLADYVWQRVEKLATLKVAKNDLGKRDLGSYVTEELNQVLSRQESLLKETQNFEKRNGITDKVVAIEYSGLVGKLLDGKEEKPPNYVPAAPEPEQGELSRPGESETVVSLPASAETNQLASPIAAQGQSAGTETNQRSVVVSGGNDVIPPTITILGNNPARLNVKDSYVDLGAYVTDNKSDNIGYSVSLDGKAVQQISIDTKDSDEYVITYTATDQAGNITIATRKVVVTDPYAKTKNFEPATTTGIAPTGQGQ